MIAAVFVRSIMTAEVKGEAHPVFSLTIDRGL